MKLRLLPCFVSHFFDLHGEQLRAGAASAMVYATHP